MLFRQKLRKFIISIPTLQSMLEVLHAEIICQTEIWIEKYKNKASKINEGKINLILNYCKEKTNSSLFYVYNLWQHCKR